jgi:uncharacterized protein
MIARQADLPAVEAALHQIVQRLVAGYRPQQIILFGSLAGGEPHEDSDIDLLIIKETDEAPLDRRVRVRRLVFDPKRRIPFSPLVLTPGELAQRLAVNDQFYRQILASGRVLYADNDAVSANWPRP